MGSFAPLHFLCRWYLILTEQSLLERVWRSPPENATIIVTRMVKHWSRLIRKKKCRSLLQGNPS
ncbi:MAG: hypothetical protein HC799_11340 [Limnothrix sp. RL_2_0]|nr:hypothetical protein [Limnothrix sp. RL_2_0]